MDVFIYFFKSYINICTVLVIIIIKKAWVLMGFPLLQTAPPLCAECYQENQLRAAHIRGLNLIAPPRMESDLKPEVRVDPK